MTKAYPIILIVENSEQFLQNSHTKESSVRRPIDFVVIQPEDTLLKSLRAVYQILRGAERDFDPRCG